MDIMHNIVPNILFPLEKAKNTIISAVGMFRPSLQNDKTVNSIQIQHDVTDRHQKHVSCNNNVITTL